MIDGSATLVIATFNASVSHFLLVLLFSEQTDLLVVLKYELFSFHSY